MLIQSWMQILDAGLTPAFGRETAFARGKGNLFRIKTLFTTLETLFVIIGIIFFSLFFFLTPLISENWFNSLTLDNQKVNSALILIFFSVSVRWISTLYRSGIIGFEDQVWLNN